MRTIIITLGLLTLLTITACGSDEITPDEYLSRAKAHLAEGSTSSAIIELKNTLQRDPQSVEARFLLGVAYIDMDQNDSAEKELRRALDLGWPQNDVYPELGDALLANGDFEALLALDAAPLSDSAAAYLLTRQSIAAWSMGDPEQSSNALVQARERNPESLQVELADVRVTSMRGDNTQALDLLETVLKQSPQSDEAWRLKAQLLRRENRPLEARDAFTQSITHSTVNFADYVNRSLLSIELEDYDAAREDAAYIQEVGPKHVSTYYVNGLILLQDKQYRPAIDLFSKALPAVRKYPQLHYYLSITNLIEDELVVAEGHAIDHLKLAPDSVPTRKLLAGILLLQNKLNNATDTLQPVLDYNPQDVGALTISTHLLIAQGELEQALIQFHILSALSNEENVGELPLTLGILPKGLGANSEEELAAAMGAGDSDAKNHVLALLGHMRKQEFEEALKLATDYKLRNIDRVAPYHLIARIQIESGDINAGQETLELALKREPYNPTTNLNLAILDEADRDADAARARYQATLSRNPAHIPTLIRLAILEKSLGEDRAMFRALQRAIDLKPSAIEPRLILARASLEAGKPEAVAGLLQPLNNLQQASPRALQLYVDAQIAQGKHASARAALRVMAETLPQSAPVRFMLWNAAADMGEPESELAALEEALQIDPTFVPALIAATEVAVLQDRQSDASDLLARLIVQEPTNQNIERLQSNIAGLKGHHSEAIEIARTAFNNAPSTQSLINYVIAQTAAGKAPDARASMERWIEQNPGDIVARLTLTNILQAAGDSKNAQQQYREVLKIDPANILALNNLAWYLRTENPTEARELIKRAVSLAPQESAVLDTQAMIEHANGKHAKAMKRIDLALERAPGNASILFHKATITADSGDSQKALVILKKLLAGEDFPEMPEAKALLAKLEAQTP